MQDVTSASAASDPSVSMYLMDTTGPANDTLGMIIFTGGQGQPLPTLSFDVVSVPEPATLALLAVAVAGFGIVSRFAPPQDGLSGAEHGRAGWNG